MGCNLCLVKSLQLQDTWLTSTAQLAEVLCGQAISGKIPQQSPSASRSSPDVYLYNTAKQRPTLSQRSLSQLCHLIQFALTKDLCLAVQQQPREFGICQIAPSLWSHTGEIRHQKSCTSARATCEACTQSPRLRPQQ